VLVLVLVLVLVVLVLVLVAALLSLLSLLLVCQRLTLRLLPQFIMPATCALNVQEGMFSFSGNDMEIKDVVTDTTIAKVSGKAISLRDSLTMNDLSGAEICTCESKLIAIRPMKHMYQGDRRVATIIKDLAIESKFKPTYKVYIWTDPALTRDSDTDTKSQEPAFQIQADFLQQNQWCYFLNDEANANSQCMARSSKDWGSYRSMYSGADCYMLEIMPGLDVALAVACMVCVDAQQDKERDN